MSEATSDLCHKGTSGGHRASRRRASSSHGRPRSPRLTGSACGACSIASRNGAHVRTAPCVFLATDLADEGVEGRREEEAKTGHTEHPEEHRRAERLPHFCPCSGGNGEWGNTQNEREGGHQDRTKARPGGVHGGSVGGDAFLLLLARELDDEDGVLGS